MSRQRSNVEVFVSNLPFTKTEEDITRILRTAGPVRNFRLVHDRETGRPKGYGFAEFADADTAQSAVRNLNNMEIDGRKLHIDFRKQGGGDDNRENSYNNSSHVGNGPGSSGASTLPPANSSATLPQLPPGRELPPGVSCTDAISQTLRTLPPEQLLDFLRALRDMAQNDTDRCVELLAQAPQLAYASFQALLLMGLVSPDVITAVLDPNSPLPRPTTTITTTFAPPFHPGGYAGPPPATASTTSFSGYGALLPVSATAAAPSNPAAIAGEEQLIQAVLSLTDEQINSLPLLEREQIQALRAAYGR